MLKHIVLWPIAKLWFCLSKLNRWRYNRLNSRHKLSKPVISIGNITMGGTGKTPISSYMITWFLKHNIQPALLSRGYGRQSKKDLLFIPPFDSIDPDLAGDEPSMLANKHQIPLSVASKRDKAGQNLLIQYGDSFNIFIMDDGFSHHRLFQDKRIVLLDLSLSPSIYRPFPLGKLREPLHLIQQADLIIPILKGEENLYTTKLIKKYVDIPSWRVHLELNKQIHWNNSLITLSEIKDQFPRIAAMAGIARPDHFFSGLAKLGLKPISTMALPDHESYTPSKLKDIFSWLKSINADFLLVTEKDAVKLMNWNQQELPMGYIALDVICSDETALNSSLLALGLTQMTS